MTPDDKRHLLAIVRAITAKIRALENARDRRRTAPRTGKRHPR